MTAVFALGLLIAAVAPTAGAASGIGSVLSFPLVLLGGVFVPLEQLPDPIARRPADPARRHLQTVRDTWSRAASGPPHLAILAATAVLAGLLAARTFRWR